MTAKPGLPTEGRSPAGYWLAVHAMPRLTSGSTTGGSRRQAILARAQDGAVPLMRTPPIGDKRSRAIAGPTATASPTHPVYNWGDVRQTRRPDPPRPHRPPRRARRLRRRSGRAPVHHRVRGSAEPSGRTPQRPLPPLPIHEATQTIIRFGIRSSACPQAEPLRHS